MIDLKTLTIEQLHLVLHNMQVYGVKVKQELLDEYNKLKKELM